MRKKKITARPLTKRHSAGNLYVRPERVEAQINEILCQDLATLKHRLAVTDDQLPSASWQKCYVLITLSGLPRVSPFKRLGHRLVEKVNEI